MGIIKDTGRAPHIAHGIVVGVLAAAFELVEHRADIRGKVLADIVEAVRESLVDLERNQQVLLQHLFDDVVGRADDVEVFPAHLDLREHGLVDVEGLVDDLDGLAGLLLIPRLEILDHRLVDVVGPVVDLEHLLAGTAAALQKQRGSDKGEYKLLHRTTAV